MIRGLGTKPAVAPSSYATELIDAIVHHSRGNMPRKLVEAGVFRAVAVRLAGPVGVAWRHGLGIDAEAGDMSAAKSPRKDRQEDKDPVDIRIEALHSALVQTSAGVTATTLGHAIGLVRDGYVHGGWGVLAAYVAAGESVLALPSWQALCDAVSAHDLEMFLQCTAPEVAARPGPIELVAQLGIDPPGGPLVAATMAELAEGLGAMPPPQAAAVTAFYAGLERAAALLGQRTADVESRPAASTALLPLQIYCQREASAPWTWARLNAWRTGAALDEGLAIARAVAAPGSCEAIVEIGDALGAALAPLLPATWEQAIVEVSARAAADSAAAPVPRALIDAIMALCEQAAIGAVATVIGALEAAQAGKLVDLAALAAELLAPPAEVAPSWTATADRVRALAEAAP
jgi:hypothetical protein